MDSLSQIVLGAAVGEVCLGKRIGNRAMLWGAIAGTIPDLDVISNLWLTPLEGLVAHRGITHSIFFAVGFSFLIAWLVKRYYDTHLYASKGIRRLAAFLGSLAVVIFFGGLTSLFYFFEVGSMLLAIVGASLMGFAIYVVYRTWKYYGLVETPFEIKVGYWAWYNFFFWTIFTHPILDCFTVYGTQLWAPLDRTRVAWNNIAVADPAYTLPFGILLILTGMYSRESSRRMMFTRIMMSYCIGYMALTFVNKYFVNQVFEKTLQEEGIIASRYMTNPSILNNVMWTATAETDLAYFQGSFSWFDKEKKFKLARIPKQHELLATASESDPTIGILRWFSNDYYSVLRRSDGRLQFNDMRYGTFNATGTGIGEDDYIFKFIIVPDRNGKYVLDGEAGRPQRGKEREMMQALWTRIKGI